MKTCSTGCAGTIIIGLLWLLASSGLLFLTWNKVIAELTKLKKVKYWQALLVVATICMFCIPRYCMKYRAHGYQKDCHTKDCQPKECPYSAKAEEAAKAVDSAAKK